jgi:protoheme IX farnesyltransferase
MSGQALRLNLVAQWRDYLELTKPKVVSLITFTAMAGMLLARPAAVSLQVLVFGSLGIALVAGAAAAINHLVDQRIDGLMRRTRRRPLPAGTLDSRRALAFALLICALGSGLLLLFTNQLTALLTLASLIGYAVIYTAFLKRATPQNIVIGGAAGAAPPLLGWVAVTGGVEAGALLLFLIIFAWTPPHFWALAIHRREEYARAGVPMLPVTHGVAFTRLQILLYTCLLSAITMLPVAIGMSGYLYLAGALLLNARFLWLAWRLWRYEEDQLAMPTFVYSITYLASLFTVMLIDRCLVLLVTP